MGWLSSPKPPKAPDYTKLAEQTAASDQAAQTRADWANRPDVVTPWGKESWASTSQIDPATGKPVTKWTQTQVLDPQAQATLDAQQAGDLAKATIAQGQLGRVGEAFSTPFDWQNLQAMGQAPTAGGVTGGQGIMAGLNRAGLGAMPQADATERQRIEGMLFDRMAPQHQQQEQGLESKLSNMGLTRGSQQWNDEMQRMQRAQADERFQAMQTGGQEMERLFGMGMAGRQQGWQEELGSGQFQNQAQQQQFEQQAAANAQNFSQGMTAANYNNAVRQQQIAEQQMRRNMPLNEYNALMTGTQVGQLQTPDFNTSEKAGATNYYGAGKDQYGAAMDQFSAKQAGKQGMMSGLGSIASVGMMAF